MWYICVYSLFPSFSVFLVCILFVFLLLCKWIWTLNIIWMQGQINDVVHFFKSARVMPKTSRNAKKHLILYYKCREMLYLTISWCYDSKKILWIRSVSKYPVNVCQGARQLNYLSVNVFAFLEREISSIYYFLSYKDSPPNNFLLLNFFSSELYCPQCAAPQ